MLVVRHVSKAYKNNQVLKDLSFEVQKGEIVALMGPSGVGKTTMLRCINQLETIDEGQILIDQDDVSKHRKRIGMVFQNFNLFPHKTVLENLIEAPLLQKLNTKAHLKEKALQLLRTLKLETKADAYPHTLSGGQKQRVAIARACMLEPDVLCFDEPTSALDRASIEDVEHIIQDLAQQGLAILIVTHDEGFAQRIATREVVFA